MSDSSKDETPDQRADRLFLALPPEGKAWVKKILQRLVDDEILKSHPRLRDEMQAQEKLLLTPTPPLAEK